ncbi:gamma-glutamyl-gamma-aminobutyrate hydrolase family protein [Xanthobacter agilis]|uniref:Gamma-glutamyl-gamma-aminobutyrate hydrolase PuuD n=1 Tax=Xanthobacter agilis TaxID=47492 RepID=A0ABU0LHU9_XANAG|nr:gamma-glutamyl-gamma-aminobutyrate hydrolase family protein [Xanthobacter agilis]MDQ0506722.1 gamma-glutamyl-gamma-aminobutyrate hydrolase PuuD [Xanthobacter agilis]
MRPLIALVGDLRDLSGLPHHIVGDKYARAVHAFAGGLPTLLTAVIARDDIGAVVSAFDGFLFTGSPSNVHPDRWGGPPQAPGPFDPARDDLSLPLIQAIIAADVPALFICRGFQELNVAQGGTLEPELRAVPGRMLHHAPEDAPTDRQYAPFHDVELVPGSPLIDVFGSARFAVNSLHYQGLARIGRRLSVEAKAPDGTPEAVRVSDHPFAVGVQWHPEYRPELSPPGARLFAAFGAAAADRRRRRTTPAPCGAT